MRREVVVVVARAARAVDEKGEAEEGEGEEKMGKDESGFTGVRRFARNVGYSSASRPGRRYTTARPLRPALPARPARCRKVLGSVGGSSWTVRSTVGMSMPRAMRSVVRRIVGAEEEAKVERLRSRWC